MSNQIEELSWLVDKRACTFLHNKFLFFCRYKLTNQKEEDKIKNRPNDQLEELQHYLVVCFEKSMFIHLNFSVTSDVTIN